MDNIAAVRHFIEDYQTAGVLDVAMQRIAPDFIDRTPFPGFSPTREGVVRLFQALREAFPDLRAEIRAQYQDDDRVATHKTFFGTHTGLFFGVEPTGRQVRIEVIDIVRMENGRIVEHWNVVDRAGLMAQLTR